MPRKTDAAPPRAKTNGKKFATQQSVDLAIKSICDIMRRGNVASALQYVPELTWILFLRILDETEDREEHEADAVGASYASSLKKPYRWKDWAAPPESANAKVNKRKELEESSTNEFKKFVNDELIPYLKKLKDRPNATARQKVISEIMSGVEKTRIDTQRNLLDVLDKVHEITNEGIDPTHVFALSQIYEGLLLKMGEKGSDAGQFFTPREVIRAMVRGIAPKLGETVYDPCCGTGGFLAQAAEYMKPKTGAKVSGAAIAQLRRETFWGREKENLIYPIGLANLILHGIDRPNIWHGNTLTGDEVYGGLFAGAPTQFDVILTNPPFGGKENKQAQTSSDYKTSATQVLFLQHIIRALKHGGRCGMVIDEGVLFRTNEDAFVKTKRKLTDECDLWCILSLPGGVFSAAGAGVKTNLLFFTKGKPTERIWYYDLSDVKVGKKTPLTLKHFEDFARKLATREDSERSWAIDLSARRAEAAADAQRFRDIARAKSQEAGRIKDRVGELKKARPRDEAAIADADARVKGLLKESREATNKAEGIENAVYDLKAVNPHRKADVDQRTPAELLDLIEAKGREVAEALAALRALTSAR
ncbi:MAG: N-6 DNA methylase [Acidobacteria bacterium RIFCSPLOWO2_02_FULL_67_36]|nr:MAG: N-6 DNA methylase [Acidobacteria bacterium RIFCSPLOWO2_02_FULL_67_36]